MEATLVALCVLSAAPEQLHQATRALDDLQYQAALERLPTEASIKAWRREELVEWLSVRALAQLGLKREGDARQSFVRLFSVAPEWVLPDHYGPRVRTFVSSARADAARSGSISLRFEGGELRAGKDAFGYARELEVSWREPGGASKTAKLPLVERQSAPWPRDERLEVWGRVLGLGSSTLFEWGSSNAPLRLEPAAVLALEGRGLRGAGWLGLGAGVAGLLSAGLGIGFAISSQEAERAAATVIRDEAGRITSLTQRAAFALDARASAQAGAATVFFVTTGLLVAAGTGLVLFDRLQVTPTPGGALLTVPLDASFGFAGVRR